MLALGIPGGQGHQFSRFMGFRHIVKVLIPFHVHCGLPNSKFAL